MPGIRMDISTYISELLYEQDCVVIPGFGGLVCNYRPAEIHPVTHVITPPGKSIAFNRLLQQNDGLLMNYLAQREGITATEALLYLQRWADNARRMLQAGEQVVLARVGSLHADVEGNILFEQDRQHNYLREAYGLRAISPAPILRGKTIGFTEKFSRDTTEYARPRRQWRWIAAVVLLLFLIGTAQLMWMNVTFDALKLNEASVLQLLHRLTGITEPDIRPIPVYEGEDTLRAVQAEQAFAPDTLPEDTYDTVQETTAFAGKPVFTDTVTDDDVQPRYYIMVGAYREPKNVEAAIQRLQQRFPDSVILIERGRKLTKLGFYAGTTYREAFAKLQQAWEEDSTFWLLKK